MKLKYSWNITENMESFLHTWRRKENALKRKTDKPSWQCDVKTLAYFEIIKRVEKLLFTGNMLSLKSKMPPQGGPCY